MYKVNNARDRIIEEARRRAREIIEEANKTAEDIIREAEKKWHKRAEAERNKIIQDANVQASIILADAKRAYSFIVNRAKREVIESIYERVLEIIKQGEYDVEISLRNLLREAMNYVENPAKVIVKKDHIEVIKRILKDLGHENIEISWSDNILGGLILVSKEGTIVDNRLETRLKQSREKLINKLVKLLWGNE